MPRVFREVNAIGRGFDRVAVPGMALIGFVFGTGAVMGLAPLPGDAWINWVAQPGTYEGLGLYVYPPVLTQALEPLRWFNAWQLYTVAWSTLAFASLGYVLGSLSFVAVLLAVPDIIVGTGDRWWAGPIEAVLLGNVTMPMVAAMVLGMRHPGWWSVPLLTKLTPGIGLAWYAFRGEWRQLFTGVGLTTMIVMVSFALSPSPWASYLTFVTTNLGADNNGPQFVGPPLPVRLALALVLLAWGARSGRAWTVPIVAATALVGLYGWGTWFSVACAALSPRLRADEVQRGERHERVVNPAGVRIG